MDTDTLCKEATPVKVPLTPVTHAGSHEVLRGGGGRRQSQKGPQLSVQMENQGPEIVLRQWV